MHPHIRDETFSENTAVVGGLGRSGAIAKDLESWAERDWIAVIDIGPRQSHGQWV
jgi:hypothetical protein